MGTLSYYWAKGANGLLVVDPYYVYYVPNGLKMLMVC